MVEVFLTLSRLLTGEESLSKALSLKYLQRAEAEPEGKHMPTLLGIWRQIRVAGGDMEQAVRQQIVNDATLGPLAKLVLFLWYAGAVPDAAGTDWRFGEADEYFSALVWSAVKAHPPALSGGYFGHWKYPPET